MSTLHLRAHLTRIAVSTVAAAVLAACGGGGGGGNESTTPVQVTPPPVAVEPDTYVSGTVTGFGSVIIDGQKLDDTAASVSIDINPAAPTTGTLADVKLGMQVQAKLSAGKLSDVVLRASAVGVVGGVDVANGSFTLMRQTVRVLTTGATPTVFEGVSGLAALAAGDVVEVHGSVDANKHIAATRVERKARTDTAAGVRIGGVLGSLNSSAKTFKLADLTVDYSSATVLPAGKTLADGQLVTVFAQAAPTGTTWVVKTVKVAGAEEGSHSGVGGRIMAYASLADFTVGGIRVDASTATFEGGTAADLAAGVAVAVEGKVSAGAIKASKVRVLKTAEDVKASLAGAVTDFVSTTSFRVRGASVDASGASFTGGVAADLGNGAAVKVVGTVKADVLQADSIEFVTPAVSAVVKAKGELHELNLLAGTFKLLGLTFKLGNTLQVQGGMVSILVNGAKVEVTGTPDANDPKLVTITKISIVTDRAPEVRLVTGRVSQITDTGFKLPGLLVVYGADAEFVGGVRADVVGGVEVIVAGIVNAQTGALTASRVEVRKPQTQTSAVPSLALKGAISDFTSKAAFRIAMQKVDASEAVFTDGTEADLANGKAVEAVGVMAGAEGARYVKLAKLRFLK
jgi:hypothetical protein